MMIQASYTSKQKIAIYSIVGLFALVYCSISLVNHYNFRTNAYDLGIYNNMMYSYSHLKLNHTSIQQPQISNAFADHFEPVFLLFAPFYWIFGSYTLLIIQIFLILAGGLGAMRYVQLFSKSNNLSIAILIQFYSMWGVYSALSFDFHNNITAAMMVPWLMFFVHQKKWKPAVAMWLVMLLSKENMALYGIFVCLGLALHYYKEKEIRNFLGILTIISAIYFVCIVKVFIPMFHAPGVGYLYDGMYQSLGSTPQQILENLVNKPGYLFSVLFENYGDPYYNGIKSELHFSVLISGGIFLLYRPQFLVMLIPIYLQKLFNSDPARWGINYHYSIEFVPVLTIATAVFFHDLKQEGIKKYVPYFIAVITLWYTISKMDRRVSTWYDKIGTRFYSKEHYQTAYDPAVLARSLKNLPVHETDAVSAQSALVPRLADRDSIYMYPNVAHARYIVLAPKTNVFPLNDSFNYSLDTLSKSLHWELVENKDEILLYKRK